MQKIRVIPLLLLKGTGVEKGIGFEDHVYVGCATNAARMFNQFNCDELILLDIVATEESRRAQLEVVAEIVEESFMPITVGGGVRSLDDMRQLLKVGADRITINTAAVETPELVTEGARQFGSQCIVVSIDARRHADGTFEVFTRCGTKATGLDPVTHAKAMEAAGCGEILLTSIDQDGTMKGYDLELTRRVADAVSVPVIACGGAGSEKHLAEGISEGHASAVAAGAFFVFFGRRRTVLITYPTDHDLKMHMPAERVRKKDRPGLWWP